MNGKNKKALLEELQTQFHEKNHAVRIAFFYGSILLINSLILTAFALIRQGQELPFPSFFFIAGLLFSEYVFSNTLGPVVERMSKNKLSEKNFQIKYPMNSQILWALFWIGLDLASDFLVLHWALSSNLTPHLIFPIFLAMKALGMMMQSYLSLYNYTDLQFILPLMVLGILAYWIGIAKITPTLSTVLATLLAKTLLGNLFVQARSKLVQNCRIQMIDCG